MVGGFWYFLYGKFTRKFRYASLAKFIMWNLFSIKTILAKYTFFQKEIFILGSLRRKRNDSKYSRAFRWLNRKIWQRQKSSVSCLLASRWKHIILEIKFDIVFIPF